MSEATPREILRFEKGHRILPFERGRLAIDAMIEAVERAEHRIHLETYILRPDSTGRRMLDALAARARAGVAVRMIVDAIGSRSLDRGLLASLERSGVETAVFNPPSRWLWRFRPRQRDHRKLLLVDGRLGFLGGLNIGNEYVAEDEEGPTWRDAHLQLEGPALGGLEALFLESWFRSGGASFDWHPLVSRESTAVGPESVAILADGPMYRRRRVRSFFIDELERARHRVVLVSPYFAPGPRVLNALADTSERGVSVELVLAGHSDHPMLRHAARAFVPALIRRGVRVYEDPDRMLHAKLAVFDDSRAVVGTSNLDRQSLDHSCEVNLVVESETLAGWILEHFAPATTSVTAIDLPTLARRSIWQRWLDRGAALLARL